MKETNQKRSTPRTVSRPAVQYPLDLSVGIGVTALWGRAHEKNHPRGVEPDKARLPRQSCLARLTRGTDSIVTQV